MQQKTPETGTVSDIPSDEVSLDWVYEEVQCGTPRRQEGCVCAGDCKEIGYCPYTYTGGVGWPD
jgi:hypothetical protein